MRLMIFRYEGNLASQEFVVSDRVAQDILDAFSYVKDPAGDIASKLMTPVITVVDEAEPLPAFVPDPENPHRSDRRRQRGWPGGVARVDLSKVASVRSVPMPPVGE